MVRQTRSEVGVGASDSNCKPTLHLERALQILSEVAVGPETSKWVEEAHTGATGVHTRSVTVLGDRLSNSDALQTVSARQTRSESIKGAAAWYSCPSTQTRSGLHTASDVTVHGALTNSFGWHWRH